MINQKAIDAFLQRKLQNHDFIKDCAAMELEGEIKLLRPRPDFNGLELWRHQQASFLLLLE